MEASRKETVIIVHGTWAAPELGARRWYQPVYGAPSVGGFVGKLDDALGERGSPARAGHNTMSPILRRVERKRKIVDIASWIGIIILFLVFTGFMYLLIWIIW